MLAIALIVALTVLLLMATAIIVGRARDKYGIQAPAVAGDPAFERAFRVQANTQEAALMFLPVLVLAGWLGDARLAAAFGVCWLLARGWYVVAYLRDAGRRGPAFALGMLMQSALLVQTLVAIARTALRA